METQLNKITIEIVLSVAGEMAQLLKCILLLQESSSIPSIHVNPPWAWAPTCMHYTHIQLHTHTHGFKNQNKTNAESERTAQCLRVLADLPGDLDSQHPKDVSQSSSRGYKAFFCTLGTRQTCGTQIHMQVRPIHLK